MNLSITLNEVPIKLTKNITKQDVMSILELETFEDLEDLLSFVSHETGYLTDYLTGLVDNISTDNNLDFEEVSVEALDAFEIVKNYVEAFIDEYVEQHELEKIGA
jgi:hypothetical protein